MVAEDDQLRFYLPGGNTIQSRQALASSYYYRNGACYALTRRCLVDQGVIFTDRTLPFVITRPLVNIDEPLELRWAELLMSELADDKADNEQQ